MPSYESDSDSDAPSDYQTTSVLLGYASKEPTEDLISIIGGQPVRLFVQSLTLLPCIFRRLTPRL